MIYDDVVVVGHPERMLSDEHAQPAAAAAAAAGSQWTREERVRLLSLWLPIILSSINSCVALSIMHTVSSMKDS
jgi:hypothetical protein